MPFSNLFLTIITSKQKKVVYNISAKYLTVEKWFFSYIIKSKVFTFYNIAIHSVSSTTLSSTDLNQETQEKTKHYILDLANRAPISFVKGEGSYLFDTQGHPYLDFICGVAVTSLGHNHPKIVSAIQDQASKLLHVSNLFYNIEQAQLAEKLIQSSFPGKAFFFNSGTEANEAAFKLCRRYGQEHKNGACTILSLKNSFHGRTTASICLTGQEKIHSGFGHLLTNHIYLPANDIKALETELTRPHPNSDTNICAFFIELIQGEGGIHPLEKEYVLQARQLCQKHKILFVLDEVQTGIGRTGNLFCYEHYNIVPDLMTLGKALGSGIPIGAMVVGEAYSSCLQRGQHGTTLGGNPLATRVALETLNVIEDYRLLDHAQKHSDYIFQRLGSLQKSFPVISEIRGKGLHIGIQLKANAAEFVSSCRDKGLLLNATANQTVRIMPPLTVSKKEIEKGLSIIEAVLAKL